MGRSTLAAIFLGVLLGGAQATTFRFLNHCTSTLWVATLAGAGTASLPLTGFELRRGANVSTAAPAAWSGRFWARTGCTGKSPGSFKCTTGDCGTGRIDCGGAAGAPPVTLVEVTLGAGDAGDDFYDVSLVDGFNVPVSISRTGCSTSSCPSNVNAYCPPELQILGSDHIMAVACMSACEKFGDPLFCCTGEYGSAATCRSTSYSEIFKDACPLAYSYAFDDTTSLFSCGGGGAAAEYLVTFCPSE